MDVGMDASRSRLYCCSGVAVQRAQSNFSSVYSGLPGAAPRREGGKKKKKKKWGGVILHDCLAFRPIMVGRQTSPKKKLKPPTAPDSFWNWNFIPSFCSFLFFFFHSYFPFLFFFFLSVCFHSSSSLFLSIFFFLFFISLCFPNFVYSFLFTFCYLLLLLLLVLLLALFLASSLVFVADSTGQRSQGHGGHSKPKAYPNASRAAAQQLVRGRVLALHQHSPIPGLLRVFLSFHFFSFHSIFFLLLFIFLCMNASW